MTLSIKAEKRDIFGKKLVKSRQEGKLPAVLYGSKEKVVSIFIDAKEFGKTLKEAGESTVVEINMPEGNKDVLIHDVQYNPVNNELVHVDFYAVDKDKKVEVDVPLVFVGESPAVKELGGILVKVVHELSIEALPKDLPHEITIDISALKDLDSQIQVKDIKLPEGVQALSDPEEVVALIEAERQEEEEEETPADIADIEVEKKGKQEEESEETKEAQE